MTRAESRKSLFSQISKGDLVTIHDNARERKGHATRREYGNWVLVLERNAGAALATKENTVEVSKPKKLAQPPRVGQRLVYDDGGRRSTGKVMAVGSRSMHVLFDKSMEPSLIQFDDPEWMDYISIERDAMPEYEAGDYVKFEMTDERTGASEWMWLRVDRVDAASQLLFGHLDSQPVVFDKELSLGQELAVKFSNVREHKKASDF
jgi:hypothetical protein